MVKTEYDDILNRLKSNRFRQLNFRTGLTEECTEAGHVAWNNKETTLDICTGRGPNLQVGFEDWFLVYNTTGEDILNGQVIHPIAGATLGIPNVALAQANTPDGISRAIWVATMNIPTGGSGIATQRGNVRGIDTSDFIVGDNVYVSPDTAGAFTADKPEFPNYPIQIGGVSIVGELDGEIVVSVKGELEDTFVNFWNGVIRESFDFRTSSDGTTITGTLEPSNGHPDLTMMFSDGFTMFDTSPPATIELTQGTDDTPQTNYIYIPKSTKELTVSTSAFPTTFEHIKVAQVFLQTAATTETEGALRNQNWNDEIQDTTSNQGHLSHIGEKLRQFEAQWDSGCEGSVDIGPADEVWIKNTSGVIYQMHRHPFPLQDMTQYTIDAVNQGNKTFTISGDGDLTNVFPEGKTINVHGVNGNEGLYTVVSTIWSDPNFIITVEEVIPSATPGDTIGDHVIVVNDFAGSYTEVLDLSDITTDAVGDPLLNTSFSVVVWGTANKSGEPSHLMANMPIGTYNKNFPEQAVVDAGASSVYTIPKAFQGVGFLIARFTFVNTGGVWSLYETQDLRGFLPNTTAGAGAGASGITTFLGLTDTPSAYTISTNRLLQENTGGTALEFSSTAISDLVPYTGATTDVDLGSHDFSATTINATTLDLGTNTITDGSMTGDWDFGAGDITAGQGAFNGGSITEGVGINNPFTTDTTNVGAGIQNDFISNTSTSLAFGYGVKFSATFTPPANVGSGAAASNLLGGFAEVGLELEDDDDLTHYGQNIFGYFSRIKAVGAGGPGTGTANIFGNGYAFYADDARTGGNYAIANQYAFYDAGQTKGTNNWGLYSQTDNFMGGDNIISKWGTTNTDLQISSDGTNGIIDVSNRLDVLGDLNVTGTGQFDRIGIGTSPIGTHKLDVAGRVQIGDVLYFADDNVNPDWHFGAITGTGLSLTESGVANVMVWEEGGNVGIGIDNPAYKLDVNGDIRTSTDLTVTGEIKGDNEIGGALVVNDDQLSQKHLYLKGNVDSPPNRVGGSARWSHIGFGSGYNFINEVGKFVWKGSAQTPGFGDNGVAWVSFTDGSASFSASNIGGAVNYTEIKSDGEINLHGTARVKKKIYIGANGIRAPGAKPATFVEDGLTGCWEFSDAIEANQESVSGTFLIPPDIDITIPITLNIGWHANGISPGNCKWQLEYLWISPNEDVTAGAQETLTIVSTASATSDGLIVAEVPGIDLPSATDKAFFWKVTRLSGDVQDTISDAVHMRGQFVEYTANSLGEAI
ncbi:MAG: hypothetical protein ACTSQA_00140 [Candidatus Heimdallarchaeaceae archaeon]